MHMVGTVALDLGGAPGAHAVALACDFCVAAGQATARLRRGVAAVVRGVTGALRAGGPVVAALVTSVRTMHAPWMTAPRVDGAHPSWGRRRPARPAGGGHRELVLPADPTAPGRARSFLRCAAHEWGVDDDVTEDAAMVLTELVANAVDHARTESTLAIGVSHEGLWVTVRDAGPGPVPRPGPIDPTAPRGRGLQMVDALTAAWGVTPHAGGKTVWALLRPPAPDQAGSR